MPFVVDLPADWEGWVAGEGLTEGAPFLISPTYEFDVVLNGYFSQASMLGAAAKTREAHARDLPAFLTFRWAARDGKGWRDPVQADHLACLAWRRRDPLGPRITGATWDRQAATVNQLYPWAVRSGHVPVMRHRRFGGVPVRWSLAGRAEGRRTSNAWRRTRTPRYGTRWNGYRQRTTGGSGTRGSGASAQMGCRFRRSGAGGRRATPPGLPDSLGPVRLAEVSGVKAAAGRRVSERVSDPEAGGAAP